MKASWGAGPRPAAGSQPASPGCSIVHVARVPSPIGELLVAATETSLCAVAFDNELSSLRRFAEATLIHDSDPLGAATAFRAYFDGDLRALSDLPVDTGGTPFQRTVWSALRRIPVGATTTYGQLAADLGRPTAMRAVGLANGSNPIAIVIPCHRVIGANGALTGYGGGLHRKRWLLEHEGVLLRQAML
ncbi:MAG TPA: methylated-DNA--[protein]-cysteine S-methyltransferase [Bryobacteraceae bacterium]|nr:methylated-DNA--[protein]-cysteine S-methyltransferase [Bryobacteraceae bacterium]